MAWVVLRSHRKHARCSHLPQSRCEYLDLGTGMPHKKMCHGLNTRRVFILKLVNLVTSSNNLLQLPSVKR